MQYIGMILSIFGMDCYIKNRVEKERKEGEDTAILKGAVILRKHHNQGAFLNFGEKRSWVVSLISVLFTVLLLGVFVVTLTGKGNTTLRVGLSCMLGGAFSNTYDRLKRRYVVDYFSLGVKWSGIRNVIFNLSDFFIMIGALMMVIGTGTADSTV